MREFLATLCVFMLSLQQSDAAENPTKLATSARFDLSADFKVGSLQDGQVVSGSGSMDRMNWIPEGDRARGYTVNFSITHTAWRESVVRFTPAESGSVTLTLMGPWEEASPGVIHRQEVLWDGLEGEGAALTNGSFEIVAGSSPAGWRSNGGTIQNATDTVPAFDGKRFARTWHNQTLSTSLQVVAGKSVILRLRACAVVPPGFEEMRRVADRDSPAHEAARRFMRGTNLGNYLEAPPGQNWGAKYSAEDFKHILAEGFDHVRLPIAWHHYAGPGPEFNLSDAIFTKADFLVNQATQEGLAVIVNVHHFDEFTSNPAAQTEKFHAIWRQIAAHYAKAPVGVAFELLNEPKDAATTPVLNPIYAVAIREIRQTNPNRTIFVGPSKWNQVSELPHLRLPDDDLNLIVTVHSYDPFQFTHQGATWAGPDVKGVKGIQFPGPPDKPLVPDPSLKVSPQMLDWIKRYNTLPAETNPSSPRAFRGVVQQAKEWSDYYGRPVHMGEFGCYIEADPVSRARFYKESREALGEAGIGWAMWDWKAGFKYWDDKTGQPAPGMREALFPNSRRK